MRPGSARAAPTSRDPIRGARVRPADRGARRRRHTPRGRGSTGPPAASAPQPGSPGQRRSRRWSRTYRRRSGQRPARERSVPAQEQVRPPGLVVLVGKIWREHRVDVAARLERWPGQPESGLLEGLTALPVVARLARGDEVLPGVPAAAMAGHDVIERQVVALAPAVLAGVAVTGEDLAPAELDPRPGPADLVLEPDDRRRVIFGTRRVDDLVVVLDDLGLLAEHEPERPRQIADVQRLVILVQDEHHSVHRWRTIPRTETRARTSARTTDRGPGRHHPRPVARPVRGSQPPACPTLVASGRPSASAMNRAATRRASRDTPCWRPIASRRYTRSSVARLPAAPGAYGQPPVPPVEASKARIPADIAAATFARAVPRVSWKWYAIRSRGMPASTARAVSSRTWGGTPTPIVSPKQTSSTPSSRSRRATSTAAAGSTAPVYGSPNAVET